MSDSSWDQFPQPFLRLIKEQEQVFDQDLVSCGLQPVIDFAEVGRVTQENDIFAAFIKKLNDFIQRDEDPGSLPPATTTDGTVISDVFEFRWMQWMAYLFRFCPEEKTDSCEGYPLFFCDSLHKPSDLQYVLDIAPRPNF